MNPNEISIEALAARIGSPDAPVLIDCRIDEDVAADPHLLPCAVRIPHRETSGRAASFGDKKIIVYCQKGLKLSMGAAAMLRDCGVDAVSLSGGQWAWRDARLPMLSIAELPATDSDDRTVWVCPARPALNDMVRIWLIRRFMDRNARCLFVSEAHVEAVAEKFDAIALRAVSSPDQAITSLMKSWEISYDALDRLAGLLAQASSSRTGIGIAYEGALKLYRDDRELEAFGLFLIDATFAAICSEGVTL